jgi:hypothetical protein
MQHARPNRLRRAVVYAALATLFGVISLSLTQCTMLGDKLTGVGLNRNVGQNCNKRCDDISVLAYTQEDKYHSETIRLCGLDNRPGHPNCTGYVDSIPSDSLARIACEADLAACLAAEDVRHAAALQSLSHFQKDCKHACNHALGEGASG